MTAYDRYAVRAFEVNALDYLVKPVNPRRLAQALGRARQRLQRGGSPQVLAPLEAADRVLLKTDTERRFVDVLDVAVVAAFGGNYTEVGLVTGERPTVRRTLKQWEDLLPASFFMRVHRNAFVNVQQIERVVRSSRGYQAFVAGQPEAFAVSRRCVAGFLRRLGW